MSSLKKITHRHKQKSDWYLPEVRVGKVGEMGEGDQKILPVTNKVWGCSTQDGYYG